MTNAEYNTTAVSVVALYDALLYFDYIVPVTGPLEVGWSIGRERRSHPDRYDPDEVRDLMKGLVVDVLPEYLKTDDFLKRLAAFFRHTAELAQECLNASAEGRTIQFDESTFAPHRQFVLDYKLYDYPLCTLPQFVT